MNTANEQTGSPTPPEVPAKATRSGSSREQEWGTLRLSHDSTLVWTERMLEALGRGNEGRQWHTLIDKVFSPKTLALAFASATKRDRAAGIDGITTQAMRQREAEELPIIERLLHENRYEPQPVRRVWIEKPGSREKRPLGIPIVRDRIVQQALRAVIEPIFERDFSVQSYGFRPGRSAQAAVARVEEQLAAGKTWVVDADIKGYFDNIPQDKLIALVKNKISDRRIIGLLEKFLGQGVMESMNGWQPTASGTPQGAIISPLLANIYLDPLDHLMARRGWEMTRYADDFIIQCHTEAEALAALVEVQKWMEEAGLTLHPEKTRVVDATGKGGFEFLGWHFERGYKWPRGKSVRKLKDSVRAKTKRNNGNDMTTIIKRVNQTLRGWGNYFRGGVRNVPERLDQWTRMRVCAAFCASVGADGGITTGLPLSVDRACCPVPQCCTATLLPLAWPIEANNLSNHGVSISNGLPPRMRLNSMARRTLLRSSSWPMTPPSRRIAHSTARSTQPLIKRWSARFAAAARL